MLNEKEIILIANEFLKLNKINNATKLDKKKFFHLVSQKILLFAL